CRCSLTAIEAHLASADRVGGDTPLAIRGPGQGDEFPLAGDTVSDFDGISDGPDVRIAGAHLAIDSDTIPLTHFKTRVASEVRLRTHADGQDNKVRLKCRSAFCAHNQAGVVAWIE